MSSMRDRVRTVSGRINTRVRLLIPWLSREPKGMNSAQWEALQAKDYHPSLEGIIERYQRDISEQDAQGWTSFIGKHLGEDIRLEGKRFLEIGHGGGWYLAQSLRGGCSSVVGVEISEIANTKARQALEHFGYDQFELFTVRDSGLAALPIRNIDVALSLTVFQHTARDVFGGYLAWLASVLTPGGVVYMQTLENDRETRIQRSPDDVLSVSYRSGAVADMVGRAGLRVIKNVAYHYSDGLDYWGIYHLATTAGYAP
jgi:SAM-dependent methyltransferase